MNNKVCEKCGKVYNSDITNCPNCGSFLTEQNYNIKNQFLELDLNKINNLNKKEESNTIPVVEDNKEISNELSKEKEEISNSIIFEPDEKYDEQIEKKINSINNRNSSLKRKPKNKKNHFLSYLLLIQSLILLFIIIFSSVYNFEIIPFCHYIPTVILLLIAFNLSVRNKESGYFLAIICSVSMVCMLYERDYISSIMGIVIFLFSFEYLVRK